MPFWIREGLKKKSWNFPIRSHKIWMFSNFEGEGGGWKVYVLKFDLFFLGFLPLIFEFFSHQNF